MKCEIIDGKLVVCPITTTEKWAVEQFFEAIPTYRSAHDYFRVATSGEIVVQNNLPNDSDPFGQTPDL